MNVDDRTRPLAMRLRMLCVAETYHCVDQIGDGVNEHPRPFAVGLWVDGTGRRFDGRIPGALLGVHLHEVKGPKQMLRAAALWEEGVPLEQLPSAAGRGGRGGKGGGGVCVVVSCCCSTY